MPADDDNLVRRALRAVGRTAHVVRRQAHPRRRRPGRRVRRRRRGAAVGRRHRPRRGGARSAPTCRSAWSGGRARVTGIGEQVEPLPFEALTFTLLTPPVHCSTPAVYAAWDDLGGPTADGPNDLEPAALVVAPELAAWRDRLGDATGQTPVLAGSGSTWFVDGAHEGDGLVVVHTVPRSLTRNARRPPPERGGRSLR